MLEMETLAGPALAGIETVELGTSALAVGGVVFVQNEKSVRHNTEAKTTDRISDISNI